MAARRENPKIEGPSGNSDNQDANQSPQSFGTYRYNVVKTALLIEGGGTMRTLANAAT
jgi:hypothetical protein